MVLLTPVTWDSKKIKVHIKRSTDGNVRSKHTYPVVIQYSGWSSSHHNKRHQLLGKREKKVQTWPIIDFMVDLIYCPYPFRINLPTLTNVRGDWAERASPSIPSREIRMMVVNFTGTWAECGAMFVFYFESTSIRWTVCVSMGNKMIVRHNRLASLGQSFPLNTHLMKGNWSFTCSTEWNRMTNAVTTGIAQFEVGFSWGIEMLMLLNWFAVYCYQRIDIKWLLSRFVFHGFSKVLRKF